MRIIALLTTLALADDPAAPQTADKPSEEMTTRELFDEVITIMTSSITCPEEPDGRVTIGKATVVIKDGTYTVEMGGKTSDAFDCLRHLGGGNYSTPYFLGHNEHGDTIVNGTTSVQYHDWIAHTPWNSPFRHRNSGGFVYTARDGEDYALYRDGLRGPVGDHEPVIQGKLDDGTYYGTVPRDGKEYPFVGVNVGIHGFDRVYFARDHAVFKGKMLYVGYAEDSESVSIVWGDEVRTYEDAHQPFGLAEHAYYYAKRDGTEFLVLDMVEGPGYPKVGSHIKLDLDGSITYQASCDGVTMQEVPWGKEPSCNTNPGRK